MISETAKVNSGMIRLLAALGALFVMSNAAIAQQSTAPEVELVMVEQHGCAYCIRWDEEIGPIYPKTALGETAPLRRINIHEPVPEDLDLARRLTFTPTFVLVVDGVEANRLEGYPGEDFFWGMVEHMVIEEGLMDPSTAG